MNTPRSRFLCRILFVLAMGHLSSGYVVFQDSFDIDEEYFAPTGGWSGANCSDAWRTDLNGGITSRLDDGCESCGCNMAVYGSGSGMSCDQSDPFDNHLVNGSPLWGNYTLTVKARNDDDDAMGVVFRYVRSNEYYLFLVSSDQVPDVSSGCSGTAAGARLIRLAPDGGDKVLKSDGSFAYVTGKTHLIRVTVSGKNIKVQFDKNADGFFGPEDLFFDAPDNDSQAILTGRIGLYAFENGAEQFGDAMICSEGGCYFDDVVVDLAPPPEGNCGDISAEGKCTGNTVTKCSSTGQLVTQDCGLTSCCRYSAYYGDYGCDGGTTCLSCGDSCVANQGGCSANLTHTWTCVADGDSDGCLEPKYQACAAGTLCDPATGQCGNACMPMCSGKACGSDGCGGICGVCDTGQTCVEGTCKPDTTCVPACGEAECGNDGCGGNCGLCQPGYACASGSCKGLPGAECTLSVQCQTGVCLPLGTEQLCTLSCNSDSVCPEGWTCITWLMGSPAKVCAPAGDIVNMTCPDVAACVGQCASNTACVSTCYLASAPQAQTTYSVLFQCILAQCSDCTDSACYNLCSIEKCFQPFADCYPGTLSCKGTLECIQDCPGADQACSSACVDQAMPAAKKQLLDLFGCLETACTGSEDSSCTANAIAGVCAQDYNGCIAGCQAQCGNAQCGPDGCGGQCGQCGPGQECQSGTCLTVCTPDCLGLECGDDGCGGECGTCGSELVCVEGVCGTGVECTSHDEVKCAGSDLYWFDSCGKKEGIAKACTYGCSKGDCMGKDQPDDDAVSGDAQDTWGNTADKDPIEFGAGGAKSSGCSAGVPSTGWGAALLFGLCMMLWARRRSR